MSVKKWPEKLLKVGGESGACVVVVVGGGGVGVGAGGDDGAVGGVGDGWWGDGG